MENVSADISVSKYFLGVIPNPFTGGRGHPCPTDFLHSVLGHLYIVSPQPTSICCRRVCMVSWRHGIRFPSAVLFFRASLWLLLLRSFISWLAISSRSHSAFMLSVCDHVLSVCGHKILPTFVGISPNLKLRCSWEQRLTDEILTCGHDKTNGQKSLVKACRG